MIQEDQHKIHVFPRPDGKWEVVIRGENPGSHFISSTKEEALDCAHELSRERGLWVFFSIY